MKENLNGYVAGAGLGLFLAGVVALWGYGVAALVAGAVLMVVASWPYVMLTLTRRKG